MIRSAVALLALFASASAFAPSCRLAVVSSSTAVQAEAGWSPKDGAAWQETDYEAELKKLEKEAEERLDAKIEEMMTKIEATGAGK